MCATSPGLRVSKLFSCFFYNLAPAGSNFLLYFRRGCCSAECRKEQYQHSQNTDGTQALKFKEMIPSLSVIPVAFFLVKAELPQVDILEFSQSCCPLEKVGVSCAFEPLGLVQMPGVHLSEHLKRQDLLTRSEWATGK